jgi:hypothetical protein
VLGRYHQGITIEPIINFPESTIGVQILESDVETEKNEWENAAAILFVDSTHRPTPAIAEQDDDIEDDLPHIGVRHLPIRWLPYSDDSPTSPQISGYVPSNGIFVESGAVDFDTHSDEQKFNGPDGPGVQVIKFITGEDNDAEDEELRKSVWLVPRHFRDDKGRDVLELSIDHDVPLLEPELSMKATWYAGDGGANAPYMLFNTAQDFRRVHYFGPRGPVGKGTRVADFSSGAPGFTTTDTPPSTVIGIDVPQFGGAANPGGGLTILAEGMYDISVTVHGTHSWLTICAQRLIPARYDQHLLVIHYQAAEARWVVQDSFDAKTFLVPYNIPLPDTVTLNSIASVPWSLQGTTAIDLKVDDRLWFAHVIHAAGDPMGRAWLMRYMHCEITKRRTHEYASLYNPIDPDTSLPTKFTSWHGIGYANMWKP